MEMFSELEESLSDLVQCTICIELLKETRVLGCGHTFCLKCLQRYGKTKSPGDKLPCPLCRADFEVPPGGFSHLSRNFLLEKILEIQACSREGLDTSSEESSSQRTAKRCHDQQNQTPTEQRQLSEGSNTASSETQVEIPERMGQETIQQVQTRQENIPEQQAPPQQEYLTVQQPHLIQHVQQEHVIRHQSVSLTPQRHQDQHQRQQGHQEQQEQLERRMQQQQHTSLAHRRHREQQLHQARQQEQQPQQQEQRRWQQSNKRRRSAAKTGFWPKRIFLISVALNFVLAASLWHKTELMENETINWTNRTNECQETIYTLRQQNTESQNLIDSRDNACEERVFMTLQECRKDLEFCQAYLQTVTELLDKRSTPHYDDSFSVT